MDLKDQKFGIEIELTGISRSRAAEVAAQHFGTSSYYVGTYYDTYAAKDSQRREWKFMSDASIEAQRKEGKVRVEASDAYQTEMVSPICRYEDIVTIQELIRKLREAGAFANQSCGIHVHIDASPFDARTLRNITNIMAAKEDLIYKRNFGRRSSPVPHSPSFLLPAGKPHSSAGSGGSVWHFPPWRSDRPGIPWSPGERIFHRASGDSPSVPHLTGPHHRCAGTAAFLSRRKNLRNGAGCGGRRSWLYMRSIWTKTG